MIIIGTKLPNTSGDRPIKRTEAYMKLQGEQHFETENYVSSPPALIVLEGNGTVWSLGFNRMFGPRGEYQFDVLANGNWTGEWASRIERRMGRIRIFTCDGWKIWSGRGFI
jgi:hypothetical protein